MSTLRELAAPLLEAVRFAEPRALLAALLVLLACAWRARSLPAGLPPLRRRLSFALGTLAALAAALALAGPEYGASLDRLTVVLAVDRSRSMELSDDPARARDEEARAALSMRENDRLARVVFGAEAATEDPPHPRETSPGAQEVGVNAGASDVAAGVRRALAEIPADTSGRVVLISDGASNRGDPLAAAAAAAAAGVPVDVVRVRPRAARNLRVRGLRVPPTVAEGETFDLRVETESSDEADVRVRVSVDGRVVGESRAHVAAGQDAVVVRQTATSAGLRRYDVTVDPLDPRVDAVVEDNRGGAFLRVRGKATVLILEGDAGHAAPLAAALRTGGFDVEERSSLGFPADLAALAAYDLVVLSDVPARFVAPEQLEQLASYVRDLGGGLLLMGGDRSMGPGGYSRTPVEEISPVSFDVRQERRRAQLSQVIAIDFSGSMAATVPTGQTKLELANEAAARSASLLTPVDRLGVMHVDTEVHWTVPLEPVGDRLARIAARIRAVQPSGGGIIIPVTLTESYRALAAQATGLRHLLLFSDGSDSEEIQGQHEVVARAFAQGITTSVVSMGSGGDTPELEHLSRAGHGRFYLVEDAARLPAVFAQETVLAARSSLREEDFRPAPDAPDVVTRGIDFAAGPPLRGWVVTEAKPRASVLLRGPDGDPILASWQIGVGRVAAFMSDAKDRWGANWLHWPSAQRLWTELARATARRPDPLIRLDADTSGGRLRLRAEARTAGGFADSLRRMTAHVTGPDGVPHEVALDPVGAGSYAAELPVERAGGYAVTLRDEQSGAAVASGGAVLLEGEELRPAADPELLERIAGMTGGRVRDSLAGLFRDRVGLRRAYAPLAPWLMYFAAASMFGALLARRAAMPEFVSRALDAQRARAAAGARARAAPAVAAQATVGALLARRRGEPSAIKPSPTALPAPTPTPMAAEPTASPTPGPTAATPAPAPSPAPRAAAPAPTAPRSAAPKQAAAAPTAATGSANLDALLARKRSQRK